MRFLTAVTVLAACAWTTVQAQAPEEPRLEAGIALGAYSFTDWRGAANRNLAVLPLPYAIYRGERVRVTRDGLRVPLLDSEYVTIGVSANFALAGRARDNPARDGMPALLNTFSAGPVLNVALSNPHNLALRWDARLPVYAVAATNFRRFEAAGFTANPQVRMRTQHDWNGMLVRTGATLGVSLADESQHDYFYEVRAAEATENRTAFDARAGFGGWGGTMFATVARGPWALGAFVRAESLHGAVFEHSPLVQREQVITGGVGLSYRFYQSKQSARVDSSE